ncbi:hypothetical protein LI99_11080 [Mycolicibacterium smegmatis]|uniref:Uncharacterized protein n=1 Tax=Mycolicibacterium smegmatis (strain ATCC 700084 / mc(2)155) TaxID=246196 RepID=A0QUJ0_MYCS2|nr:hypothetical protein MSMEG_2226 [Mycolicibacterium smegmatis MC2 155]AIU14046.1 hypothetical protein LI99_11080 [Mycolicibacterium smegmatis]AIU07421.1 hypothetical protein LJ00_11080 [Mycolicibacterium smegmatis MC2 155]AIU20669.1 hypothetical protein LI98_11085 [Mycolicibacterium smegmatis]TBH33926.1 hypothetical protein EYS45_20325 [Mycolicibacterium smegmatis MC2 155]
MPTGKVDGVVTRRRACIGAVQASADGILGAIDRPRADDMSGMDFDGGARCGKATGR